MKQLSLVGMLLIGLNLTAAEPESSDTGSPSLQRGQRYQHRVIKRDQFMREEEREPHGPGFFVNIGFFSPSQSYMDPHYAELFRDVGKFKTGITFETGNYFRLLHTDRMGLGLRATWLQLGYGKHQDTAFSEGNAFASPLRIGPQASFLLGEQIGLDAFYQLGAQYNIDWYRQENLSFAGISHELGFSLRYTLFSAGLAYRFGALKNVDTSDPKTRDIDKDHKYDVNSFRVFIGIQL